MAASPASGGRTRRSSATPRAGGPFGLAFLDPPYGQNLAGPALAALVSGGWLEADALCVVEEAAKAEIVAPAGLTRIDERVYGDTRIAILAAGSVGGRGVNAALAPSGLAAFALARLRGGARKPTRSPRPR